MPGGAGRGAGHVALGAGQAAYENLLAGEATKPATNLRPELTSFVGRSAARRDIEKLLGTSRLVTLVGHGGVGKTRLATRVAGEVLAHYPDGVWTVEQADLADGGLLAQHFSPPLARPHPRGRRPSTRCVPI